MTDDKKTEHRLKLMEILNTQQSSVRDLIDKWFGNYLLIMGAPLPVVAAILNYKIQVPIDPAYYWIVPSFFFVLGLHFFAINVRQRMSAATYADRIIDLQSAIYGTLMGSEPQHRFSKTPFGADYWKGAVVALFNSIWGCLTAYLFFRFCRPDVFERFHLLQPQWKFFWAGILAALLYALQMVIRHLLVSPRSKRSTPASPTSHAPHRSLRDIKTTPSVPIEDIGTATPPS
ncbi:MAG: hypothetical protein JO314_05925 [Acidobacteria bacterium]|nr:hypothetical protein [Acidobacteriota bacterium]